jgi:hypothetical protein
MISRMLRRMFPSQDAISASSAIGFPTSLTFKTKEGQLVRGQVVASATRTKDPTTEFPSVVRNDQWDLLEPRVTLSNGKSYSLTSSAVSKLFAEVPGHIDEKTEGQIRPFFGLIGAYIHHDGAHFRELKVEDLDGAAVNRVDWNLETPLTAVPWVRQSTDLQSASDAQPKGVADPAKSMK